MEACHRVLWQVERVVGFPVSLVSIWGGRERAALVLLTMGDRQPSCVPPARSCTLFSTQQSSKSPIAIATEGRPRQCSPPPRPKITLLFTDAVTPLFPGTLRPHLRQSRTLWHGVGLDGSTLRFPLGVYLSRSLSHSAQRSGLLGCGWGGQGGTTERINGKTNGNAKSYFTDSVCLSSMLARKAIEKWICQKGRRVARRTKGKGWIWVKQVKSPPGS